MSQPTTAPLPAAKQPASRNILPKEAFVFNLEGARQWLAETRAAWEKRRAEFPDAPNFAPTLKQLEERDFRSLVAGGWIRI